MGADHFGSADFLLVFIKAEYLLQRVLLVFFQFRDIDKIALLKRYYYNLGRVI